ncbi:hypothetical protein ASU31_00655 [Pedobacter ginsenosidimutans]|uniref:HTH araC/xylS-type domain-containing protein n=1 Tax=Pedobacter ginsenosidimutans TaxID=687842 RepID=A0A0T5VVL0_9SPHI|nr:response regulator transcription factor [Pedobacter ginsenosidimutans]KRT17840.1 hypothetical protein ASU31_00655 [Pedobacter ginsenosidimutans]
MLAPIEKIPNQRLLVLINQLQVNLQKTITEIKTINPNLTDQRHLSISNQHDELVHLFNLTSDLSNELDIHFSALNSLSLDFDNSTQPRNTDMLLSDIRSVFIIEKNNHIRRLLESSGIYSFSYISFEDSESSQQILEMMPDLIILDLATFSSSEFTEWILLSQGHSTYSPPIIAIGNENHTFSIHQLTYPNIIFLPKPINKSALENQLKKAVENRMCLQSYFHMQITSRCAPYEVLAGDRRFVKNLIMLIEEDLSKQNCIIDRLAERLSISRSTLYKKTIAAAGQSINSFIRYIRLRKAAQLMICTNFSVLQIANVVGIHDRKYFKVQFSKLFIQSPAEFIKMHRSG